MSLSIRPTTVLERKQGLDDPYLKLHITPETTALLSMTYTQEAVIVPGSRINPIPNMPSCLLGLLNQRNRIFWVADLARILGMPALDPRSQRYSIVILQVGNVPLAIAVTEIVGVERIAEQQFQSPIGAFPPSLTPFLRGCLPQGDELLLLLDADAIVHSSQLQSES